MKVEPSLASGHYFSTLDPKVRAIWAKSGEPLGHGLLAHLLDVAAVGETLLLREPQSTRDWACKALGLDDTQLPRWIAAIVGLHDFGKAIPGFQIKWIPGMEATLPTGLTYPPVSCSMDRHDLGSASLLGLALFQRQIGSAGWIAHVVQAISAHHGYHFLPDECNGGKPRQEPPEWSETRHRLLDVFWHILVPEGSPDVDELSLAAVNWLAGLTSAADWIASNPEWFAFGERGLDDLHAYYADACLRANVALKDAGWYAHRQLLTQSLSTDEVIAQVVAKPGLTARPLQLAGDRLLRDVTGPALLLVEAPMGEGKTELAFLAHLRLQAANGHRGLYVALPTQATGNALFKRAMTFLEQFADGPMDVQLVHGGAAMNEDVRHLRGIDHNRQEGLAASAWFSQRKRPLLSPYGVGTVDQALYAVLNVKHHFVRLWGLSNRVIVLDEIHAYDTYTNGLIVALLRWLKAVGCSVVLMSATLPSARRAELLQAWGVSAHHEMSELAYPRVLLADDMGIRGEHFDGRVLAPIHLNAVGWQLDAMAQQAMDLLGQGGCGAVIVNTVDRAQKLFMDLRARLPAEIPILLFHARFPADDRADHERSVLEAFGATGERPGVALLIATQVAEQSLDIDFDFMLSDLAPVDLLLQRAGRLHRHVRKRPDAHAKPRFWVAGLDRTALPELKETAWGYVYDPYILLRTWVQLRDQTLLELPSDIDGLVQAVYSDDALPDDLEAAARTLIEIESYGAYLARVQKERREALNIAIDPSEEPQTAYRGKPRGNEEGEGLGLENKTRLGRESITVIPLELAEGGWCIRKGEETFKSDQPISDGLARRLYGRQLKVSRAGLVRHLKAQELPVAFQHPMLRNCYPLLLRDGRYDQDGQSAALDDRLGLVFLPAVIATENAA